MNLEIDVLTGRVLVDGQVVWTAGEPAPLPQSDCAVRYLDLTAHLVIGEAECKGVVAAVLFDEEEFPDSILTSRMVKRFAKETGVHRGASRFVELRITPYDPSSNIKPPKVGTWNGWVIVKPGSLYRDMALSGWAGQL